MVGKEIAEGVNSGTALPFLSPVQPETGIVMRNGESELHRQQQMGKTILPMLTSPRRSVT